MEFVSVPYMFIAIIMVYSPVGVPEHRLIWKEHDSVESCYAQKDAFHEYAEMKKLSARAYCTIRGRES